MAKKVLCNISNGEMPEDMCDHKQNMQTYAGLLGFFDEIHVVCRNSGRKSISKKHPELPLYVHHIKVPRGYISRYLVSVLKMIVAVWLLDRKYNFTVFDASEPTTGGVVASVCKILCGKKYLLEFQGELTNIDPATIGFARAKGIKWISLWVAKNADRMRAVSHTVARQLSACGISEEKITVVPARVDLNDFDIQIYYEQKEVIREELGLCADEAMFIFIGRLVPFKGVRFLLEAIKDIKNRRFKLVVIGDGELRLELEALAHDYNIFEKIHFMGSVPFQQVPRYLSAADLFILPSLDEGFGRVVIEAMALKIPVIASRVGGIKDIIVDGETGYFCEPKDPQSIVRAVERFYREDTSVITQRAYEKVLEHYEFNKAMKEFQNLFREL